MITFPPLPGTSRCNWFDKLDLSPVVCLEYTFTFYLCDYDGFEWRCSGKSGLEPQALSYGSKSLWAGSTPGPGRAGDSSDASGGEMELFFPPLLGPRVVCVFFRIQRISILCLYLGLFDGPHSHTLSLLEVGCICIFFY